MATMTTAIYTYIQYTAHAMPPCQWNGVLRHDFIENIFILIFLISTDEYAKPGPEGMTHIALE